MDAMNLKCNTCDCKVIDCKCQNAKWLSILNSGKPVSINIESDKKKYIDAKDLPISNN